MTSIDEHCEHQRIKHLIFVPIDSEVQWEKQWESKAEKYFGLHVHSVKARVVH